MKILWFSILVLVLALFAILGSINLSHKKAHLQLTDSKVSLAEGETLYRRGNGYQHIPACITCHGANGKGNTQAGFPILTSQPMLYTLNQLKGFKDKTRKNDVNAVMQNITAHMTERDMEAVALYIQSLKHD